MSKKKPSTTPTLRMAGAGDVGEPATRVLRNFRLVFNAVKTHFRQVERRAGVGGAQLWALSIIRSQPGIGINELARAMDVQQSTASNLIKALSQREMVTAEKSGADRRAVQLRLLPAGSHVLRKAPGPFSGVLPDALSGLDPKTLKRLDEDLSKLIKALGGAPAYVRTDKVAIQRYNVSRAPLRCWR